jgi:hypothetical protein
MTSGTTREFMALHALAMHNGRQGVPTDQAYIEIEPSTQHLLQ